MHEGHQNAVKRLSITMLRPLHMILLLLSLLAGLLPCCVAQEAPDTAPKLPLSAVEARGVDKWQSLRLRLAFDGDGHSWKHALTKSGSRQLQQSTEVCNATSPCRNPADCCGAGACGSAPSFCGLLCISGPCLGNTNSTNHTNSSLSGSGFCNASSPCPSPSDCCHVTTNASGVCGSTATFCEVSCISGPCMVNSSISKDILTASGASVSHELNKKVLSTAAVIGIVCGAVVGTVFLGAFVMKARQVWVAKQRAKSFLVSPSSISRDSSTPSKPAGAKRARLVNETGMSPTEGLPELVGLMKGEIFFHAAARYYTWISSAALPQPVQALEAGVNDTQLDSAVQYTADGSVYSPVVQLSGEELWSQIMLVSDGLLGRGGAALVFKCCWPSRFGPDNLLACKVLKEGSDADPATMQSFAYEAKVLSQARHVNIVRIYGYCLEPPTICIIMELLPSSLKNMLYPETPSSAPAIITMPMAGPASPFGEGGGAAASNDISAQSSGLLSPGVAPAASSSQDSISKQQASDSMASEKVAARVSLQHVVNVSAQVAEGLAYLHELPDPASTEGLACGREGRIVHRDLKPANLLINSHGVVKISDFGLAREHLNTTIGTVHVGAGTLPYMAPELLLAAQTGALGVAPTNKVDIYSVAMLMYEMLVGQPPWRGMTHTSIMIAVMNRRRPPLPEGITNESEELSTLGPALPTHLNFMKQPLLPQLCTIIMACWHHRESRRPTAQALHGMLTTLQQELKQGQNSVRACDGEE